MSVPVMTVLFFALLIGWFGLAFLPALRELKHGTDARALPVASDGRTTPSYFADRFRRVLTARLAEPAAEVRATGRTLTRAVEGEERFVVLPARHDRLEPDGDGALDALVMAVGDLEIPEGLALLREVYVEGRLRTEPEALLRATLAEGGIELGAGTVSLRWLHSARDLEIGPGCRLYGRASAVTSMHVAVGTLFEKLHAHRIVFGPSTESGSTPERPEQRVIGRDDLGAAAEEAGGRVRFAGDLELPEHCRFVGDLVVTGRLTVGTNTRIVGSVKARGLVLGDDVEIDGALVSSADLVTGRRCRIHGPLLAEGDVVVGAGCRVGSQTHPSTFRAARIDVHAGTVVYGTVWTLEGGGEVHA